MTCHDIIGDSYISTGTPSSYYYHNVISSPSEFSRTISTRTCACNHSSLSAGMSVESSWIQTSGVPRDKRLDMTLHRTSSSADVILERPILCRRGQKTELLPSDPPTDFRGRRKFNNISELLHWFARMIRVMEGSLMVNQLTSHHLSKVMLHRVDVRNRGYDGLSVFPLDMTACWCPSRTL
jgi:hypothetical protein